jgi:hypothetical protein
MLYHTAYSNHTSIVHNSGVLCQYKCSRAARLGPSLFFMYHRNRISHKAVVTLTMAVLPPVANQAQNCFLLIWLWHVLGRPWSPIASQPKYTAGSGGARDTSRCRHHVSYERSYETYSTVSGRSARPDRRLDPWQARGCTAQVNMLPLLHSFSVRP